MRRTVREWVEFLNIDENQRFALKSEGGITVKIKNYKPYQEFLDCYDDYWFEQPVVRTYVDNLPNYHLLIIPMN